MPARQMWAYREWSPLFRCTAVASVTLFTAVTRVGRHGATPRLQLRLTAALPAALCRSVAPQLQVDVSVTGRLQPCATLASSCVGDTCAAPESTCSALSTRQLGRHAQRKPWALMQLVFCQTRHIWWDIFLLAFCERNQ